MFYGNLKNIKKRIQKTIDKLAQTNYIITCELAIANYGHFHECQMHSVLLSTIEAGERPL